MLRIFHLFVSNNFSHIPSIGNREFLLDVFSKISSVSGNLSQMTKLLVNLKSAIFKCNAVISELVAVLNFAVVGLNWSLETFVDVLVC